MDRSEVAGEIGNCGRDEGFVYCGFPVGEICFDDTKGNVWVGSALTADLSLTETNATKSVWLIGWQVNFKLFIPYLRCTPTCGDGIITVPFEDRRGIF